MASKSLRNLLAIVSTANGIALIIKDSTKAKTPQKLADKLDAACRDAMATWPGQMSEKELDRIRNFLSGIEERFIPERGRPELLTSIALGLIDDVAPMIKDPVRKSCLSRVEDALFGLQKYYDRNLDRFDEYARAGKCIEYWLSNREAI